MHSEVMTMPGIDIRELLYQYKVIAENGCQEPYPGNTRTSKEDMFGDGQILTEDYLINQVHLKSPVGVAICEVIANGGHVMWDPGFNVGERGHLRFAALNAAATAHNLRHALTLALADQPTIAVKAPRRKGRI